MPFDVLLNDMHHFFYVFARVLGLVLGMPFLSQTEIPSRFKATACFGLTLALAPMVADDYFPTNLTPIYAFIRFFIEFLLGFFIGLVARFALAAVDFAGNLISTASGLSMATMYNPTQNAQGSVISAFLTLSAVTLFLITDGHHYIIKNFLHTYKVFSNHWFEWESQLLPDLMKALLDMSEELFKAGLGMSVPFLILNSILQIALGFIGKVVPQIQVFFMSMSLQVVIGLFVLFLCIGTLMLNYEKLTVSLYTSIGLNYG